MADQNQINDFLAQRVLAVAGVSRSGKKYGNRVFHDLIRKGYRIFAINPYASEIEGQPCAPDLASLPEPVGGVVAVVPPEITLRLVQDLKRAGIQRLWMQPGAESNDVIQQCREVEISAIAGECIMQYPVAAR